ncbi:MAG: peptidase U32 family protein [Spirochaeta sp.]
MEILSPAGNLEKLNIAFAYGADAVYMGLPGLSLRAGAESWDNQQVAQLPAALDYWRKIKPRKLYVALNRYVHQKDIPVLAGIAEKIGTLPADAFIISDLGMIPSLKRMFPDIELHLSTQANCTNSEAARMYLDMGFSRIVAARELTLAEIADMKQQVPELEIEVFVHGAVCIAYSGRCLLSSWLTGRSANHGECTHSCRWQYREFEEKKRPGSPLRVEEHDGFSTIFSPEDMCMIQHLDKLRQAGVHSLKIEGRMKSAYYVAVATQAYLAELDKVRGVPHSTAAAHHAAASRQLLMELPHRGYSTGMYFGTPKLETPPSEHGPRFMGIIQPTEDTNRYAVEVKNRFSVNDEVEIISPGMSLPVPLQGDLENEDGTPADSLYHGKPGYIRTSRHIPPYSIVRKPHKPTPPGA